MKKYAVAFINFFDNDLKLEIIDAQSDVFAAYKYLLLNHADYDLPNFDTVKELDTFMNDCDAAIEVEEVV